MGVGGCFEVGNYVVGVDGGFGSFEGGKTSISMALEVEGSLK